MNNISLPNYSEFRIQDVINRLAGIRSTLGWGELNDDLLVAIECLEYARDVIIAEDLAPVVEEPDTDPKIEVLAEVVKALVLTMDPKDLERILEDSDLEGSRHDG